MAEGPARFPTTHWSLVLAAGQSTIGRPALEALCAAYWTPVYVFVRRQGNDTEAAKDLTQSFFARLLEKRKIAAAEPGRGRFRSFLLACVKNFLANEWDRVRTQKRGGGQPVLPFEFEDAEHWLRLEPVDQMTPERLFERRWASLQLARALDRLRAEHERAGKGAQFQRLRPFLSEDSAESYGEVAAGMGMSAGAVKVAVHRMRRRYRDILRAEIEETVGDPQDADDEIRYLRAVLQRL